MTATTLSAAKISWMFAESPLPPSLTKISSGATVTPRSPKSCLAISSTRNSYPVSGPYPLNVSARAIAVGPVEARPRRCQTLEHAGIGVAVRIARAHRDHGDRRADGAEEGGRARRARPVVRDLEDGRGERRPRGDESLLARGFDVGREQERRE